MSSYRIEVPQLERVTRAIGYVCIFWAWMDEWLDDMIDNLTPLDRLKLTKSQVDKIAQIRAANADIRTKIRMLKAIAFVCKWDDAWFKKVEKQLDRIDNDLRPKRNHFIHDHWTAIPRGKGKGHSLQRRSRHTKFKRPQAFALELSTEEYTPVKMKEVWDLGRNIIDATMKLVRLWLEFESFQKYIDEQVQRDIAKRQARMLWNDVLLPLLSISSQQSPHPQESDIRPKNARSSRKRRPQSSRG
jgi:hypothetical protein